MKEMIVVRISWKFIGLLDIRAGEGIFEFLIFLFSNIITQFLFTGSDYWLSAWTDYTERESLNLIFDRNPIIAESRDVNIYIYRFIIFCFFNILSLDTDPYLLILLE